MAGPDPGTFGLSLSWIQLFRKKVHDLNGVPSAVGFGGHAPSWGDGASSLFCELVTMPVALSSHWPF